MFLTQVLRPIPLLSKEGCPRKRTGWLRKSRSYIIDVREAHRFEGGGFLRLYRGYATLQTTPALRATLLDKEGNGVTAASGFLVQS